MALTVEAAVERLCQVTGAPWKQQGDEIRTGCPLCPQDTHHLYLTAGDKQPVVIRCVKNEDHGPEIVRKFFAENGKQNGTNGNHPAGVTTRYDYHDRQGILRYFVEVTRFPGGGKQSRMGQPGPHGDRWDLRGVERLLWHLPDLEKLPDGALVLLPEGERDVLSCERAGFHATTNAGGTGGWNASLALLLKRFCVGVPFDADVPGLRLAEKKLVDLTAAGIECRRIDLGYPITAEHGKDITDWLREHTAGDLAEKIQQSFQIVSPEPPTVATAERFRLLTRSDLRALPRPEWQVEGMIEQESLVVMFGPSGSGKTFLSASIALGLTTGGNWFTTACQSGPVLYVNADGGIGFKERVVAWEQEMGLTHPFEFLVIQEAVNLMQTSEVIEVVEKIKQQPEAAWPKLVVIDTLARCMAGGDENSTGDMGIVIRNCNYLQRELKCTVLLVHHTGWAEGERMRGNSSLHAAADAVIRVVNEAGIHRVSCEKQRNGDRFPSFAFRLEKQGDSCGVRLLGGSFTAPQPSRLQAGRQAGSERVLELVRQAEKAVQDLDDEGLRADWSLIKNTLSDVNQNTLKDWVRDLRRTGQIVGWNRPMPDAPKHFVYGIGPKDEDDV